MAAKEKLLGSDWRDRYDPEVQQKIEAGFRVGLLVQRRADLQNQTLSEVRRGADLKNFVAPTDASIQELDRIVELREFISREIK